MKVPILQHLENLRDEELEERREKRRRQLAEEEESKQNDRRASGAEQAREQSLQVGESVIFFLFTSTTMLQTNVFGFWTTLFKIAFICEKT